MKRFFTLFFIIAIIATSVFLASSSLAQGTGLPVSKDNASQLAEFAVLKGLTPPSALAISADETLLATANTDGQITLWDIPGQTELFTMSAPMDVIALVFSPDGSRLVSSSWVYGDVNGAYVWDTQTGEQLFQLEYTYPLTAIAFSPDGTLLATGDTNQYAIYLWDTQTGQQQQTLLGHTGALNTLTFNATGTQLISGGDDQAVRVWDITTGEMVSDYQYLLTPPSNGVPMPGAWSGQAVEQDPDDMFTFRAYLGWIDVSADSSQITSCTFISSYKYFYYGDTPWTITDGEFEGKLLGEKGDEDITVTGTIDSSQTNGMLIIRGNLQGLFPGWIGIDMEIAFNPPAITGVWYDAAPDYVLAYSEDNILHRWKIGDEKADMVSFSEVAALNEASINPEGIAAVAGDDQSLQLLDATTGDLITQYEIDQPIFMATFNPTGTLIAFVDEDNVIHVWHVAE